MTSTFDEVIIIYNPKSTGNGKANAIKLADDLKEAGYPIEITLRETKRAGHIEEMARTYATSKKSYLIISSSGDGGYHELVNGIVDSSATNIVTGVLPSGNANDHYNAVVNNDTDIVQRIIAGAAHAMDVLKISSTIGGTPWTRYAHSYAGIGISPVVGEQLTKTDLNFFSEKWLVLKYLFVYKHTIIRIDGKKKRYSSLVFGNIDQMSKVIKLSKTSSTNDGKFEVSAITYKSKLRSALLLIKSATFGLDELGSFDRYSFESVRRLPIQLDGEVYMIDSNSTVQIECASGKLKTIL